MNTSLLIHTAVVALPPLLPRLAALKNHLARLAAAAVLAGLGHCAHAEVAPAIHFDVTRSGDDVVINARATPRANLATTWNVLVGYDRLPQFIPGMKTSDASARNGNTATVVQTGVASWGVFQQKFSVTLQVQEEPMHWVSAQAVAGDFSVMESRYEVAPGDASSGTQLVYRARIQPRNGIPPVLGLHVMGQVARKQFQALIDEIERQGQDAPR